MPVLFVYYVYDNPTYEVANKLICISVQDDVRFDVMTALAVNSIPVRYPGSVIDTDQYPNISQI